MTEQETNSVSPISSKVTKKIHMTLESLHRQAAFIQSVSQAVENDELEKVLRILANNSEFVTHDFIQSLTGFSLAEYLVESAANMLMQKYPFLNQFKTPSPEKQRVFYIGDWYKADTRRILFLNINLENDHFALDLYIAPEVLEEWQAMDTVKSSMQKDLDDKQLEFAEAKDHYRKRRDEQKAEEEQRLEELEKKHHLLTSKVLKKQSEIQEVERNIKKAETTLTDLEERPEEVFADEYKRMASLSESIDALQARLENIHLIEALVKREKNEISSQAKSVKAFIDDINYLANVFAAKN